MRIGGTGVLRNDILLASNRTTHVPLQTRGVAEVDVPAVFGLSDHKWPILMTGAVHWRPRAVLTPV
jgi:hypothetical protein